MPKENRSMSWQASLFLLQKRFGSCCLLLARRFPEGFTSTRAARWQPFALPSHLAIGHLPRAHRSGVKREIPGAPALAPAVELLQQFRRQVRLSEGVFLGRVVI